LDSLDYTPKKGGSFAHRDLNHVNSEQ